MKTSLRISLALMLICLCSCVRVPKNEQKASALLDKIYAKHPSLLRNDTVTQNDTLYLPETTIDTVFSYVKGDTVVIRDKATGTKVRVRVDTVERKVYVSLDQSPTVIRQKQTIREKTIIREKEPISYKKVLVWILVGGVLSLIIRHLIKAILN